MFPGICLQILLLGILSPTAKIHFETKGGKSKTNFVPGVSFLFICIASLQRKGERQVWLALTDLGAIRNVKVGDMRRGKQGDIPQKPTRLPPQENR